MDVVFRWPELAPFSPFIFFLFFAPFLSSLTLYRNYVVEHLALWLDPGEFPTCLRCSVALVTLTLASYFFVFV